MGSWVSVLVGSSSGLWEKPAAAVSITVIPNQTTSWPIIHRHYQPALKQWTGRDDSPSGWPSVKVANESPRSVWFVLHAYALTEGAPAKTKENKVKKQRTLRNGNTATPAKTRKPHPATATPWRAKT